MPNNDFVTFHKNLYSDLYITRFCDLSQELIFWSVYNTILWPSTRIYTLICISLQHDAVDHAYLELWILWPSTRIYTLICISLQHDAVDHAYLELWILWPSTRIYTLICISLQHDAVDHAYLELWILLNQKFKISIA